MFSQELSDAIRVQYGDSLQHKANIAKALSDAGAPEPYTMVNGSIEMVGDILKFTVLDSDDIAIQIQYDGKTVSQIRTVSQEDKDAIVKLIHTSIGPDADYKIADTYTDFIDVYARGVHYKWKDGTLTTDQ
jgi:excinuclease UvrABC helicase subunit UvrB